MEMWEILDVDGNKTGVIKARGDKLLEGEYHLVVMVWIMNPASEFLLSKRTPNKEWPLMWETTGGSATVGEDSLAAALKETREELGIILDPARGEVFNRYVKHDRGAIYDSWLFRQDVDLADVVFQEDETCDAMYASPATILHMIEKGECIGFEFYPYLLDLFEMTRRE